MLIPGVAPGDAEPHAEPHAEPRADSRTRSQPRGAAGSREEPGAGAEAPAGRDMAQGSGETEAGGEGGWRQQLPGQPHSGHMVPGEPVPAAGLSGAAQVAPAWAGCFGTARGAEGLVRAAAPASASTHPLPRPLDGASLPRPAPWQPSSPSRSPSGWVPRGLCPCSPGMLCRDPSAPTRPFRGPRACPHGKVHAEHPLGQPPRAPAH